MPPGGEGLLPTSQLIPLVGLTLALTVREWSYGQLDYLFGITTKHGDSESIRAATGLDNEEYAWLVGVEQTSVLTLFFFLSGVLGTLRMFRRRKERLVVGGLLLQLTGVLVIANALTYKQVVAGQLLNAAGAGLSYPAAFRVVHDFFPGRAAGSGLLIGARSFGMGLNSIGLWAVETGAVTWRGDFYLIAAVLGVAALLLVGIPDMSDVSISEEAAAAEQTTLESEHQRDDSKPGQQALSSMAFDACSLMCTPFAGGLVLAGCLGSASDDLMQAWAPSFFIALTSDPAAFALENAVIIQVIAGTFGAVCGGILADVWEFRGISSAGPNPAAMVQVPAIGLVVAGASMYAMLYTHSYRVAFICYCVFEPAMKTFYAPVFVALQGTLQPRLRDIGLGIFMFVTWDIGASIESFIGTGKWTYEDKLAYIVPFCLAGGMTLWLISGWFKDARIYRDVPEPPPTPIPADEGPEGERLIVSEQH